MAIQGTHREPFVQAVIQVRMGSTRLPGKAMLDLLGKPVIAHLIDRLRDSRTLQRIVAATTTAPGDDRLAAYLRGELGLDVFRGSEDDVLDRFYQAAQVYPCDVVVRVTADDPLKDARIVDEAVGYLLGDPTLDYCSNTLKPTYPEGLDIEVFRMAALARAWAEAKQPSEREHVTPYIWKHPERFRLHNFCYRVDRSGWRWTLDDPADFTFIQAVYRHFYRGGRAAFSYEEVIAYLERNPHLLDLNAGTARNAGYLRSLAKESA